MRAKLPPGLGFFLSVGVLADLTGVPGAVLWATRPGGTTWWLPWQNWPRLLAGPDHTTALGVALIVLVLAGWAAVKNGQNAPGSSSRLAQSRFRTARELTHGGWVAWPKPLTTLPPPVASPASPRPKTEEASRRAGGLIMGFDERGTAYVQDQDEHIILIGTTGSRKTSNVILPSIGVMGAAGESMVILDPKGELFQKTHTWLNRQGYLTPRHDFRVPTLGQQINLLDPIVEAFHPFPDRHGETPPADWAQASQRAAQLADALVGPPGPEGALWRNWSRDLIAAAACAVADMAEEGTKHLPSVAHLIADQPDLDFLTHFFDQFDPQHPANLAYASIRQSQAENRASIMSTTNSHVGLLRQGAMAWMLSRSDYALEDIGRRKMAVFLVFPPNDATFYPLITLYLHSLLRALSDLAYRSPGRRLPIRVNGVLDEFGSFPAIPDFEKTLSTCRSEGVRMTLVVQAYSQLSTAYAEGRAATIRNSCNTTMFLSTNDYGTAKEISEALGQTVVMTQSRSTDHGPQAQGRYTESLNETLHPLMSPDQILHDIKPGTNLVLQIQQYPVRLTMHRMEDYQAIFPFEDQHDPSAPHAPAPKVWPDYAPPPPETAHDPDLVVTDQVALPDDALVAGPYWEDAMQALNA